MGVKVVKPLVFKIAETRIIPEEVTRMLEALGGNSKHMQEVLRSNQGSEALIETAGRICYRSFDVGLNPNVTKIRTDSREYISNLLKRGEGSVLEHGYCSFAFLHVSRIFTHELARHRVGIALSQESLRYVRPREIGFWVPDELSPAQREEMIRAVEAAEAAYRRLERSVAWEELPMEAKKRLTSALRRVLPDGISTHVIWTANHRTLRWVIEMRTDPAAEVEMRMVFDQVAQICKRDHPYIYGDFVREELPDGTGTWRPTLRSKA